MKRALVLAAFVVAVVVVIWLRREDPTQAVESFAPPISPSIRAQEASGEALTVPVVAEEQIARAEVPAAVPEQRDDASSPPDVAVAEEDELVHFFGRLVDAETGASIAGAVRVASKRSGGISRRSSESGETVFKPHATSFDDAEPIESDAAGSFEIKATLSARPFASATAVGYGEVVFAVARGTSDATNPLIVRMSPTATLTVCVLDHARDRRPVGNVRVKLSASGFDLQQRETMLDFFSSDESNWSELTGADGRVAFADLPARIPLLLSAGAYGLPSLEETEPLVLKPRERREITLALGAAANVFGRLEDERGGGLPGCELWLVPATSNKPALLRVTPKPVATARTDSTGAFRFDAVPVGRWWVGPEPHSQAVSDELVPLARVVQVRDSDESIAIVVQAERRLEITGSVVDASGRPEATCSVFAHAFGFEGAIATNTDLQGRFVLAPVPAGVWRVQARSLDDDSVPSRVLEVQAGARDVVLTIHEAASITGEVRDPRTGQLVASEVSLGRTDSDDPGWAASWSEKSWFEFNSVAPGNYTLTARARDGRVGVRSGVVVAPGARLENVRIELGPGARLELAYEGASAHATCRVLVDGAPVAVTSFQRGTRDVVLVPPGDVELRWREHDAYEVVHRHRTSIRAGERQLVELRR